MLYIIAANLGQARRFAADAQLAPTQWTYLHSAYQIRGIKSPNVVRDRTARERDNLDELNEAIDLAQDEYPIVKSVTYLATATESSHAIH